MIRVAIIEDETIHAENLQAVLNRYAEENGKSFDIKWYQSPLNFKDTYSCQFDMLFFDIKMPGIDGMQLAKKIREIDHNVVICFTTSLAQYAIEGYSVNAVDYILKPYSYEEFQLKMNRIFNKFLKEEKKYILCQKDRAKYKIPVDNIIYIDTNIHQVGVHTEHESYTRYASMGEIEKELAGCGFMKINSCYLVNTKAIQSVHRDECVMKNGTSLKISRSHYKEVSSLFKKD